MNKIGQRKARPNEYVLYEDYAEILVDSPTFGEFRIQIDLEDVEFCKQHIWHVKKIYSNRTTTYYPDTIANNKCSLLHTFLLPAPSGFVTDHIDGDEWNNRRNNLQICTYSQNASKQKKRITNKSGATGVIWNKKEEKWMAYLKINYRFKNLGYYNDFDDAVSARKAGERKYFEGYLPVDNQ